ncbi:MAG: fatty acid desaturase [Pseudobdellovibrionaceae bacterium]
MNKQSYLKIRKDLKVGAGLPCFIRHLCIDTLLIAILIIWCQRFVGSPLAGLASPLIAILMFRSFALMHDAVHSAVLKSKINDFIGTLYGGAALLPFEPWRRSHLEHHFWSGNAEKDPVMALLIVFPRFPLWLKNSLSFGWKKWLPIMAVLQHIVFWTLSFKNFLKTEFSFKMVSSLAWPVLFWSLIFWKTPTSLIFSTLIPGLFLYLNGVEIVNLPHHLRLPQLSGTSRYAIWDQHHSSRTCLYPRWIEEYVTLNFNYHSEHHMFPELPWFQLSQIHHKIREVLAEELNMDRQFAWTVEHRRHDLTYILANDKKQEDLSGSDFTEKQDVRPQPSLQQ